MPREKQTQLTDPVKNYLIMKIAQSGLQPQLLESERTLCPRFGISRPTLHRAIEELVSAGYCLRFPGYRGVYSNPERYLPGIRNIGIMSSDAFAPTFVCSQALSSFIGSFSDLRTFINFTRLTSTTTDERLEELRGLGYAGFLIYCHGSSTGLLSPMMESGIPVVALGYYDLANHGRYPGHYVGYPYEQAVSQRVDFVREHGYRKVVMLTSYQEYVDVFQRLSGNLLTAGHAIIDENDILRRLPGILQSYEPDLLIADGGYSRYHRLFHVLENTVAPKPELLIYPQLERLVPSSVQAKYCIHYMDDSQIFHEMGCHAAELLKHQINDVESRSGNDENKGHLSDWSLS